MLFPCAVSLSLYLRVLVALNYTTCAHSPPRLYLRLSVRRLALGKLGCKVLRGLSDRLGVELCGALQLLVHQLRAGLEGSAGEMLEHQLRAGL